MGDSSVHVVIRTVQIERLRAVAGVAQTSVVVVLDRYESWWRRREGRAHRIDVESVAGPRTRRVEKERLLEHAAAAAH